MFSERKDGTWAFMPAESQPVSSPMIHFVSFSLLWTSPMALTFLKNLPFSFPFCLYFSPSVSFYSVTPQGSLRGFAVGHQTASLQLLLHGTEPHEWKAVEFLSILATAVWKLPTEMDFWKMSMLFSVLLRASLLQGDNELHFTLICLRILPCFLAQQLSYN